MTLICLFLLFLNFQKNNFVITYKYTILYIFLKRYYSFQNINNIMTEVEDLQTENALLNSELILC